MAISPARTAAFDILRQVEQKDAYAAELLHSARYENLSLADHAMATELVMGVLRWRSLLDRQIAERSSKKLHQLDAEVLTALRLAAYQLLFLDRVPKHAAVHESVELVRRARKRSAVPFANAVLRKLADKSGKLNVLAEAATAEISGTLSELTAHPQWLVERWVHQFGLESARQICIHDQHAPESAVRLRDVTADELKRDRIELAAGKLLVSARIVQAGNVSRTEAFRQGRVAIQDEASQLAALLVGQGKNILDCCAAPGGKTRVLAERNPGARIVAIDLHPHRARLLRKLVPDKNVEVIAADVRELPVAGPFDCVLADVPCSGTGTLGRNPEVKWRLRQEDLADLQTRQVEILRSAMKHVAPGGRLVYSTCSLEREENSEVVEQVLGADSSFGLLDSRKELERLRSKGEIAWEGSSSLSEGPYLRTIPGVHPCDGFFAAVLQKS